MTWLLAFHLLFGTIVEWSTADECAFVPQAEDWVVVDIDETLIRYPSHLGSRHWFEEMNRTLEQAEFHRLAGLLAAELPVVAVEPALIALLREWQDRGAVVIGVTAREPTHPAVADWKGCTARQVESVGLSFERSAPYLGDDQVHEGILFTGWGKKGPVVADRVGRRPGRLVAIDDRLSDLQQLEESVECEFLGIWYRANEGHRESYDAEVARAELQGLIDQQGDRNVVDGGRRIGEVAQATVGFSELVGLGDE